MSDEKLLQQILEDVMQLKNKFNIDQNLNSCSLIDFVGTDENQNELFAINYKKIVPYMALKILELVQRVETLENNA
jgi:hypothetical protein